MRRSRTEWAVFIGFVLTMAVSAGPAFAQRAVVGSSGQSPQDAQASEAIGHAESLSRAFRYASTKVLPAVVKISAKTAARRVRVSEPFGFGDLFSGERYIPESDGTGSGVIISSKGIILTNNHVVSGADQITVRMEDGTEYEAADVRTDPDSDLAIVRIKADKPLPFARMGDSDRLEIGDWVLAIGHPFDLESSVSAGIVSAKGRSLDAAKRATFLQTDAAINPGNSGGPLVNLRGEIVGINTAIASRSGGFNGISFAIPVNLAKWVSTQLVRDGEVHRAWLGVGVSKVTPVIRSVAKLGSRVNGLWVGEVHQGTPSELGGIRPGDVITHVKGEPIRELTQLQRLVEKAPAGSSIPVGVVRSGKPIELVVKAATMPNKVKAKGPTEIRGIRESQAVAVDPFGLGPMLLYAVDDNIAKQLGTTAGGILILRTTGEAAYRQGLTPGSIINTINGQSVSDLESFVEAIESVGVDKPLVVHLEVPQQAQKVVVLSPVG
ncbi:trypsin-like peptidase domain-containing protein [Planctomycetota bacterium]